MKKKKWTENNSIAIFRYGTKSIRKDSPIENLYFSKHFYFLGVAMEMMLYTHGNNATLMRLAFIDKTM